MSKTIIQALRDEIFYPVPIGKIENIVMRRGLTGNSEVSASTLQSGEFKGALADCLVSLLQAVNISEADKSIGALTDAQRKAILKQANKLYGEIGEDPTEDPLAPKVYINC